MDKLTQQYYRLILHEELQLYAVQGADGNYSSRYGESLSPEVLEAHIKGEASLGVRLLQPGTNVAKAGCIDFDTNGCLQELYQTVLSVQKVATDKGIPSYIEFSGRKGFHLWLFATKPMPGLTWYKALKSLGKGANFDSKEVFPAGGGVTLSGGSFGVGNGQQPIKLPYAVHRANGKRSGFLTDNFEWSEGIPVIPPDQAELMASFEQVDPKLIHELASLYEEEKKTASVSEVDLSKLGDMEHPACIMLLITRGARREREYNKECLTLATYIKGRGYSEEIALDLGTRLAEATPADHPTTKKTVEQKMEHFKRVLKSVMDNDTYETYKCACTLTSCKLNNLKVEEPERVPTKAEIFIEGEFLARVIHDESSLQEALHMEVPIESFLLPEAKSLWLAIQELFSSGCEIRQATLLNAVEGNTQNLLDALYNTKELCKPHTFTDYCIKLREAGLRRIAIKHAQEATASLEDINTPITETLDELVNKAKTIQKQKASDIKPMSDYMQELEQDLFSKSKPSLYTPSNWLNEILNGGWQGRKLYVLGAPPGAGKTTFASWCADFTACQGTPVLYVSYEMGRNQLWYYSLSRLGEINSKFIEGKNWHDRAKLAQAIHTYKHQIAPHITVLEAGIEATPAYLKGVIDVVRGKAGLNEESPILVVIDYLHLMYTGDEKLDSSTNETVRISKIATSLKQLSRDTNTAVIAISDITKEAYLTALKSGGLSMASLRDSFKVAHAADVVLVLQSTVTEDGTKDQLDFLDEQFSNDPKLGRTIRNLRAHQKEETKDTWARLNVLKNRGGMLAEPLFLYRKAHHTFIPVAEGYTGLQKYIEITTTSSEVEQAQKEVAVTVEAEASSYVYVTAEEHLNNLLVMKQSPILAIDTETTGLDPQLDKVRLVQLAVPGEVPLILDLFKLGDGATKLIQDILGNPDQVKIFHNAKFDISMLAGSGFEVRGEIFDTMLASQTVRAGLGGHSLAEVAREYGGVTLPKENQKSDWSKDELMSDQLEYASKDVSILLPLYEKLKHEIKESNLDEVFQLEMGLLPVIRAKEANGILFDASRLEQEKERLIQEKEALANEIKGVLGDINLNSSPQKKKALKEVGVEVASVDKDKLKLILDKHPVLEKLVRYSDVNAILTSIETTYPKHIHPLTGRIHANFKQYGTVTGRMSCSSPNMQNPPRSAGFRSAFIAPPGWKLVIADYSQIEIRIACELSKCPIMLGAYRKGEDLHRLTASVITGKKLEEITKADRQKAKAVNFGLIYGMQAPSLVNQAKSEYGVEMTVQEAKDYIKRYFEYYTGIKAWHDKIKKKSSREAYTLSGRRRRSLKYLPLTELLNTPCQGTGADILKRSLVLLHQRIDQESIKLINSIHDEIVLEVVEEKAEEAKAILVECMEQAGYYYLKSVEVIAEASICDNWAGK